MTSTLTHSGAGPPRPSAHAVPAAPPSTYGTQTLPIAVPLPDFWRQQPTSQRQPQQHQPEYHYVNTNAHVNAASSGPAVMHDSSHHAYHAAASSSRSNHQQHDITNSRPSPNHPTAINAYSQPLQSSHPAVYYAQPQSTDSSYAYHYGPAPSDNQASSSSALPVQYHHAVASTSAPPSHVQSTKNEVKPVPSSSKKQSLGKENVRPASPKPTKKPSQRDRSATLDTTTQDGTNGPDTPTAADDPDSYDDAELTARFSSVSQIEAQPTLDPETGEAVYPCPFCDKHYGGKHARSIWRRHLSHKHGIPLNIQPRRTRWDNDTNRPKDEAERHKRTLESKRRWAAKNRAEKRAKRKGTTVEEELGLIEAAEAAEAAAAAAAANGKGIENTIGNVSVYNEGNAGDESFNSRYEQVASAPNQSAPPQHPVYQIQHHQVPQGYWQDTRQAQTTQLQPLQTSSNHYASPAPVQYAQPHPNQQHMQLQHVRYASHPPQPHQIGCSSQATYVEADAGHQSYTVVYPASALSPDPNAASARFQRSPSQPEFPMHIQQGPAYAASVSPVDGSFAQQQAQQVQYLQPVYHQQVLHHRSSGEAQATAPRLLQTVPLAQQLFLAPPSSSGQTSAALQRSVSAPLSTSGPVYNRQNPPRLQQVPAPPQISAASGPAVTYIQQYHQQPVYAAQSNAQQSESASAGASTERPASSNGMTIYIPPPPQNAQAWNNSAEQATPLARPAPAYTSQEQAPSQTQVPTHDGQPPTPYFYVSVPESTPVANQQTPVAYATQPTVPIAISQASTNATLPNEQAPSPAVHTSAAEEPKTVILEHATISAAFEQVSTSCKTEGKKKPAQPTTSSKSTTKKPSAASKQKKESSNASHSTKTYQEAAMQLLALKTASSSPPASPVKEIYPRDGQDDEEEDEENVDTWKSTDGGGSLAEIEDSGFAAHDDDISLPKAKKAEVETLRTAEDNDKHVGLADEEEDEDEEQRTNLRFASIPPSSPAPRMSLSPESSPMPLVPSKLSATYLRAQASANRSTPLGMKRKLAVSSNKAHMDESALQDSSDVENMEDDGEEDDDEGERISLDSSPEREDSETKAPLAKRRLVSMSSAAGASPKSRIRDRHVTSTATSNSRSPSPSRYTSGNSSFATSVIMSTPLVGNESSQRGQQGTHSQAPDGLFYTGIGGNSQLGGHNGNGAGKSRYSHHHRSSIFKIDNCSRPSAGLGMAASSSSPSRPFLLSSPEHAAVSKSLGLVPDNFAHSTSLSMSLPSDSEGFEMHFLRGFNRDEGAVQDVGNKGKGHYGRGSGGMGLSEYAKDVFGGPLGGL